MKCFRCRTPIRPAFPWCECKDGQCIVNADCREVLPLLEPVDLVFPSHDRELNHKFDVPCSCSPKTWKAWITELRKVYDEYDRG